MKRKNNNKVKNRRRNQGLLGGRRFGNENTPPRVLGSQQIQTQLKTADRIETRTVTALMAQITSTPAGVVNLAVGANFPGYTLTSGTSAVVTNYDVGWLTSFQQCRVKAVELVWNPSLPVSTATSTIYSAYDTMQASATTLAAVLNYNNIVRFDPREGTSYVFRIKNQASTAGSATVYQGGWVEAATFPSFFGSVVLTPGVIYLYGNNLGTSVALGNLEVRYLIQARGRY